MTIWLKKLQAKLNSLMEGIYCFIEIVFRLDRLCNEPVSENIWTPGVSVSCLSRPVTELEATVKQPNIKNNYFILFVLPNQVAQDVRL